MFYQCHLYELLVRTVFDINTPNLTRRIVAVGHVRMLTAVPRHILSVNGIGSKRGLTCVLIKWACGQSGGHVAAVAAPSPPRRHLVATRRLGLRASLAAV
eukprot:8631987-Pyramimonas_sp.AAC.1